MVKVSVEYNGQYFVALNYDSGYRFLGEEFPAGQQVEGRYQGERAAERDAADWRVKLTAAGIKVE